MSLLTRATISLTSSGSCALTLTPSARTNKTIGNRYFIITHILSYGLFSSQTASRTNDNRLFASLIVDSIHRQRLILPEMPLIRKAQLRLFNFYFGSRRQPVERRIYSFLIAPRY